MAEVSVGGNKNVELGLSGPKKLAIAKLRPAMLMRSDDLVLDQVLPEWRRRALIKQDFHAARLRPACASTASTCARVTPGNHSKNSSMVAPASRFSNSACTGTRVPLNNHAPLTLSGMRSTTGHVRQSSMEEVYHTNERGAGSLRPLSTFYLLICCSTVLSISSGSARPCTDHPATRRDTPPAPWSAGSASRPALPGAAAPPLHRASSAAHTPCRSRT